MNSVKFLRTPFLQNTSGRLLLIKIFYRDEKARLNIIISNLVNRTDNIEPLSVVKKVNELLFTLQLNVIDNSNIGTQELSHRWLHVNSKGSGKIAGNFIKKIEEFKWSWLVTGLISNNAWHN